MKRYKSLFLFLLAGFSHYCRGQPVTFSKDIAPVIFKNCTPCHRPGQIAPMPFNNYQEIVSYASMIKYVTGIRYMPPWLPTESEHMFENERSLSDHEVSLIKAWVDQGVVRGDSILEPSLQLFDDQPLMTSPDLVLSMSEAFEQYGVYYDQFKVFVLPYELEKDQQIEAIEFVPGNKSIVRSCFVSVETETGSDVLDQWDPQYGYFSFGEVGVTPYESRWYVWTPQKKMTVYPSGGYKTLPRKGRLLFHIHYGPTGVPLKDSSSIRLRFLRKEPGRVLTNIPLLHHHNLTNKPLSIEAGSTTRFHASIVLPFDLEVHSLMPHSHLLGRRWEVFSVDTSSRKTLPLLKINDWDFKWKDQFIFKKPVVLQKGTVLHALAEYDNTNENLSNPSDPPRAMQQGKRMFEESFLVYLEASILPIDKSPNIHLLAAPTIVNKEPMKIRVQIDQAMELSGSIKNYENESIFPVLEKKKMQPGNHSFVIDVAQLPKGNYYLEFTAQNKPLLKHLFVKIKLPGVQ